MDEKGLVPLEYQDAMRRHQTTLRELDMTLQATETIGTESTVTHTDTAQRGWTESQKAAVRRILLDASVGRILLSASEAYMATCRRVAALPVEERRHLGDKTRKELKEFDDLQRRTVEVVWVKCCDTRFCFCFVFKDVITLIRTGQCCDLPMPLLCSCPAPPCPAMPCHAMLQVLELRTASAVQILRDLEGLVKDVNQLIRDNQSDSFACHQPVVQQRIACNLLIYRAVYVFFLIDYLSHTLIQILI